MGLVSYAKQLILLRFIGHMKLAHVKLDILKITMHSENDTVQVRWRIRGVITGWKVFSVFWKKNLENTTCHKISANQKIWYDGFFTLMLNGKVYKHIADKMMPNQDTATKKKDMRMAGKLALFTGLVSIFSNDEDSLS
ncbi:uncharacterized protein C6orf136-like isoform X2 [Temnothorax curvispinosus]|uniref:Uncharacterized protein C6orf136-like isoform X1 n=1 Tax=Temnothorax curvispinosus TaxID=300111 RepID=A0A6J1PYM3_9HYME|nr:uncharacterized protein C6orf136-like isoform X1 [Temnothorax curvispinosus]XP_024874978.1 uncharacterized protein C6orf136-like isoform X1 [Temnothorax curvispinosus]XP_024874984.1 uncharacterized protein C6orf136-like isoform X2 [Temnothorax curvispinosus]